jgi:hypothetical protein
LSGLSIADRKWRRRTGVSPLIEMLEDEEKIRQKLEELRSEHRDLDDIIGRLVTANAYDQLQMQRLKKRKLVLKDLIARLESALLPDIPA